MTELQAAFDRIEQHIIRQMDYHCIPGLACALFDRERILRVTAHGVVNLDSQAPVQPQHLFMTGSIGKSFTAIALLQLHQAGRLELHAPVTDYLPWFEVGGDHAEPVTVHQLLTHTGGVIGVNDVLTDKLYDVWALRHAHANWAPGSRYHYSNVGYKTLGLVLEAVEGSSYGEIIRRRILDPLGMTATEPETTLEMRHKLVTGYLPYFDDRPWLPHHGLTPAAWLEIATGEGCLAAPVAEQAIYMQAIMNRDPRLLSTESFGLFTAKHAEVEPDHWYGYGIDRDEIDGHTILSHGGEMPGHMAWMWADLDTGLGFAILINCIAPLYSIARTIHQTLAAAASDQPLPELPDLADRTLIEQASDYAGRYSSMSADAAAFELVARDQRLFLRAGGREAEVWRTADETYVADHPDFCRLPLRFQGAVDTGFLIRHGEARYASDRVRARESSVDVVLDERGDITGHYRSYGSVFTNFRIVSGWEGEPLFVNPLGEEWIMERLDPTTWRLNQSPETVRFETFVEGQALRASFSGCDYYRTFTA